jgi:hypothetical protein
MLQLIQFLTGLASHEGELTADAIKGYADIAHGEGGLAKVQQGLADVGKLVTDAAAAATGV